jgi:DNA-binding XRE family transcriptional regulator
MAVRILELAGRKWAILPERDYRRLAGAAGEEGPWPDLPKPDARGRYPAVEYARASLARKIIKARRGVGISQAQLARRAGIRAETLNRIERGKTTPDVATIAKIDWALHDARSPQE